MRVFVTGAGGFVGRSVVARLVAEGHTVRALVRPAARAAARALKDPPVTPDELRMLLAARPCGIRPMTEAFGLEPVGFERALMGYANELKTAAGLA